ncbi:hypothetical protein CLV93_11322 [Prolixibacter denitrificans]|nr:hypothetical protein CLV93_11322 [Prolixibacter denitrificans]
MEVGWYDNISCLQIDEIIWSLYNQIAIPHKKGTINPDNYLKQLSKIKEPIEEEKRNEFYEHKNKLEQLISGYKSKTLKTILKTTIPVTPVKEKTIIRIQYFDLETEIILSPEFMTSGQSMVSATSDNSVIPMANSQWQHCICKISVSINGLLDSSYPSENLSLPPEKGNHNSPFVHNYLFELVEKISWNIYKPEDHIGRWLITPNDIGAITYLTLANDNELYNTKIDPPGQSLSISKQNKEVIIENHSITIQKQWFDKCLILAIDKLGTGNTNEAIFWLNAGIEALFEEKTRSICEQSNIDYDEFTSSKSYWINAKELVEKYIPRQEADKIEWPTTKNGKTSWFSIIKNLSKQVELKEGYKKILSHYSKVNKHRNAIFHGSNQHRVDGKTVNEAIASFNWIKDNYKMKMTPNNGT